MIKWKAQLNELQRFLTEKYVLIFILHEDIKKRKKNQSQGGNLKRFKKHLNSVQQNKIIENLRDCLYVSQPSKLCGGNSRGFHPFYSAVRLFNSLCLDCFALLCQVSFFILLYLHLPWNFSSGVDKQHFLWAKVLHKLLGNFQLP